VRKITGRLYGWLDDIYFNGKNKLFSRDPLLFAQGWGSDACIEAVSDRLLQPGNSHPIDVQWKNPVRQHGGNYVRDGYFESPFFREHLPPESTRVNFRMVSPGLDAAYPLVLHTATTREDDYRSREITASALAEKGIGTVLMEGPFRGSRRPSYQASANLARFSDFFLLCGSAIEESRSLLQWLYDAGHRKLGIAGISKGGYIASVAGLHSRMPLGIATLVAPHSGVPVFLEGLTRRMCDWRNLQSTCGAGLVKDKLRNLFLKTGLDSMIAPGPDKKVIVIGAVNDRFVPRNSYETMSRHWKNAEFRWLPGGHVSSILDRKSFVRAVGDAMTDFGGPDAGGNQRDFSQVAA
jgi:hypothetical protein